MQSTALFSFSFLAGAFMKELSLHILDIAQNSISAGCNLLEISLTQQDGLLTLTIRDDGRGMSPEFLASVTDPFTTTRTTRKVGLGLPLLRLAAEQTGGTLSIESALGIGTTVTATFAYGHIDCPPAGDMAGTIALLVQGAPGIELIYSRTTPTGTFTFDTREVRAVLGADVSLAEPEVFLWIQGYLTELEDSLSF